MTDQRLVEYRDENNSSSSIERKIPPLSNPYHYDALPGKGFMRLLEFTGDKDSGRPDFRLIMANLDEAPRYRAISYTWSPVNPVHVIYCGEAEMAIGHNIYHCLSRLQRVDGYERLWQCC